MGHKFYLLKEERVQATFYRLEAQTTASQFSKKVEQAVIRGADAKYEKSVNKREGKHTKKATQRECGMSIVF